jgi:myosin-1
VAPTPKYTPAADTTPTPAKNASSSGSALPPPPRYGVPPPPPAPSKPMYKAKYPFEGQTGELSLAKDEVVELIQKDDNGESKWISSRFWADALSFRLVVDEEG